MSIATEAPNALEGVRTLSEKRALEILTDTAICISEFINLARRAVSKADPELLAQVINEQPLDESLDPDARKRPRGRSHPMMTLFKMVIAASRNLTRVLEWTNPELSVASNPGNLQATVNAAENMMKGLEKMVTGLNGA